MEFDDDLNRQIMLISGFKAKINLPPDNHRKNALKLFRSLSITLEIKEKHMFVIDRLGKKTFALIFKEVQSIKIMAAFGPDRRPQMPIP